MTSIFGTERRESNEILCQFDQIRSRSIRKLIKFFSKFKSPAVGLRDQLVDVIVTWTQKHATELDKDRCYASLMVASPLKFPAPQGKFELWRGCFRRRIQWKNIHVYSSHFRVSDGNIWTQTEGKQCTMANNDMCSGSGIPEL